MANLTDCICERCWDDREMVSPAAHELDSWGDGSGGGELLCDRCFSNAAEAAYEAMLSDYYGGSGPQSINEQYQAADIERRELWRLD